MLIKNKSTKLMTPEALYRYINLELENRGRKNGVKK